MAPRDPLIGQKLGDYEILDLLGQGGMARVYRGHDSALDRYAAVKVIEPHLLASQDKADYEDRFLREARAVARLDHPRIVRVYQFGRSDDQALYYMAMSFINGRDLREILQELNQRGKRLAFPQILRILRDIASALDYAHRQYVIHRDVKPSNIMVTADGHAVLTDFGLALDVDEGTIGNSFGSVHYIAPEQAVSSSQVVPESDLYSLGIVLFEMLTGRVPFEDTSALSIALKHVSDPPPKPSELNPEVSEELEQVVLKALSKRPEDRYRTGVALIRAVEQAFLNVESGGTQPLLEWPTSEIAARQSQGQVEGDAVPVEEGKPEPALAAGLVGTSTDKRTARDDMPTFISGPKLRRKIRKAVEDSQPRRKEPVVVETDHVTPDKQVDAPILDDGPGEAVQAEPRRRRFVYLGIVAALLVLVLLLLLRRPDTANDDSDVFSDTHDTQTAIAQNVSSTATSTAVLTSTGIPQLNATMTPTAPAVQQADTTTPTQRSARFRTAIPTMTATLPGTTAPGKTIDETSSGLALVQADKGQTDVILRYDGRTLVLLNQSDGAVNVSDLTFVRLSADGTDDILFRAREWSVEAVFGLDAGDCLQVWTTDFLTLDADDPPADICTFRQGTRQTARGFWVTTQDEVSFEIRLFGDVLARCPVWDVESRLTLVDVSIVECRVDLPGE